MDEKKTTKEKDLHSGHRERMRKRFLETEGVGMSDHELLEILLFFSIPRYNTNETAHKLIDAFGSLAGVFNASFKNIISVDGVGANSALLIKLFSVLMNRYSVSGLQSKRLRVKKVEDAVPYLQKLLFAKAEEELYVLLFRETGMLITCQSITMGKDAVSVHANLNQCFRLALQHSATFVILAHNHPNGVLKPSALDIRLTQNLSMMLESINVTLAEHILIADNKHLCIQEYMREHSYYV